MPAEQKYMTVEDVARYLGVKKQTIYNKVHNNEIPYHKVGSKAVRFKKEEIDAWIKPVLPDDAEKYMMVEDVAQYLGYERQTIYNKVHNNEIPFHKIGPKAVRFKKDEIDAWVQSQKERERQYIKKGERYYLILNTPHSASQMSTDYELLLDVIKETSSLWQHKAASFKDCLFSEDDLMKAKEILKSGLVYPRLIKGKTPVYEWIDSGCVTNYLTILKLFKGQLKVDFLLQLKARIVENVKERFYSTLPPIEDQAKISFEIESVAGDILSELCLTLIFLASAKKDEKSRYITYANRYFDKETLLALYVDGFCYFDKNPLSDGADSYILKDKPVEELTPDQIALGLKEKVISNEEVTDLISRMEADLKALKSIVKKPLKGGAK